MRAYQRVRFAALGAALVLVAWSQPGCATPKDRLVYENYTQVRKNRHTREDVQAILGEPDQKLDDRWMYERPDKHLMVFVEFDDQGRVSRTQWIDAMDASWHDTSDHDRTDKGKNTGHP